METEFYYKYFTILGLIFLFLIMVWYNMNKDVCLEEEFEKEDFIDYHRKEKKND